MKQERVEYHVRSYRVGSRISGTIGKFTNPADAALCVIKNMSEPCSYERKFKIIEKHFFQKVYFDGVVA